MTARTLTQARLGMLGWILLPLGILALGYGACVALSGCKLPAAETAQDVLFVGTETDQQKMCVDHFAPNAAKQDSCRAAVKAVWDAYWKDHCDDGGSCR